MARVNQHHIPGQAWLELLIGATSRIFFLNSPVMALCEFIGEPYDENMQKVDLSKSNYSRWKQTFSDNDKEIFGSSAESVGCFWFR